MVLSVEIVLCVSLDFSNDKNQFLCVPFPEKIMLSSDNSLSSQPKSWFYCLNKRPYQTQLLLLNVCSSLKHSD